MLGTIRESERRTMSGRDTSEPGFGERLRRARLAAGLTQEELAERAGLSVRGISDLERGARRSPRRDTLALLADALQLDEAERERWLRARRIATSNDPAPDILPLYRTSLVGRQRELELLHGAVDRGASGHGSVVLIGGEPGVGKTRLAGDLADYAGHRGFFPIWGRCHEDEGAPSYWPWVQILRVVLDSRERSTLRHAMGLGASDLAQLLPELHRLWPDLPRVTIEGEPARFRLFDSVTTFLRNVSGRQPLLIVLDDLQWADRSSLQLLEFLGRSIQSDPLVVLALFRDSEVDQNQPLAGTIVEVNREPANQHIWLRGLSEPEVQVMIRTLSDGGIPEDLVPTISARTGGNPFFVGEIVGLLDALPAASQRREHLDWTRVIPLGVRELIRQRLGRVSPQCREILAVASVIGREFDLRLLSGVSEQPAGELVDPLDEAVRARLIDEPSEATIPYRFVHDLIRETIYDDLRPTRRLRLHERVALTLERLHASNLAPRYGRIARHFVLAAPIAGHERAVRYLTLAGDQAMRHVAYSNAADHFSEAIDLLAHFCSANDEHRVDALLGLAEAWRRAGDIPKARETFQLAADIARSVNLPQHFARAAIGFSGGIVLLGRYDTAAIALLDEAAELLGPEDSALKAQCMARSALAFEGYGKERPPERLTLSQRAVEIARRVGDPEALAVALHVHHQDLRRTGDVSRYTRLTVPQAMVEAAADAGNLELLFTGRCWRMFGPLLIGDVPMVDSLIRDCQQLAAELRQPFYTYVLTGIRAMRAVLSGRLSEAGELAEQARLLGEEVGVPSLHRVFWEWLFKFQLSAELDRMDDLNPLALDTLERMSESPTLDYPLRWQVVAAQIAVMRASGLIGADSSRHETQTLARVTDIGSLVTELGLRRRNGWISHCLYAAVHLAQAASIVNDTGSARVMHDWLAPDARFVATVGGAFMCVGSVAHYVGLLSTTLSWWDDAERHFGTALATNERIGARPFAARTRYAWAEMLLRRGRRDDRERARRLLADASVAAAEIGMLSLQRQASELGSHYFGQPSLDPAPPSERDTSSTAQPHPAGLTPREIDVLHLLAKGYSNRQIADELFIALRTVENHVSHVLDKLEVPSRTAAARKAVDLGLAID
jgi:DNA-binding CsgD family transcriptional regulator/transcriptional regulator with XRE-family HTH domain/tetratricopeptide (TPR) repeat protein